jgi:hypothetical protein
MELAIFVYLISVLGKLGAGLLVAIIVGAVVLLILAIWFASEVSDSHYSWNTNRDGTPTDRYQARLQSVRRGLKWTTIILALAVVLHLFIPSTKIAWIMAGAYAAQQVIEDPRAGEIGNKVFALINQQLDQLITDSKPAAQTGPTQQPADKK